MAVTNSANTDAALALRLFGNTAANTAAVNIQTGVQQVQQVAAYPQHQLLAAASMVLPYYHPTPAGHQFVAAALSAQKSSEGQTVGTEQHQSAFQQPSQQQQNSATAAAAPSMMFLTRIAAHAASNQSAAATTLAVLPTATAAVVVKDLLLKYFSIVNIVICKPLMCHVLQKVSLSLDKSILST